MARPSTYTDEQKAKAKAIYEERGPHAAARELGFPVSTIGSWAADYDWRTFANEKLQEAVKARSIRVAATRSALAEEMLNACARLVERLDEVVEVDLEGKFVKQIDAKDAKDLAMAVGILLDKVRLELGESTSRSELVGAEHLLERARERGLHLVESA